MHKGDGKGEGLEEEEEEADGVQSAGAKAKKQKSQWGAVSAPMPHAQRLMQMLLRILRRAAYAARALPRVLCRACSAARAAPCLSLLACLPWPAATLAIRKLDASPPLAVSVGVDVVEGPGSLDVAEGHGSIVAGPGTSHARECL